MSDMERASSLLEQIPQYKLGYVIAYLQGMVAGVADDLEEIPNAVTIAAMQELENGGGERWTGSTEELFAMLDAEDEANA